MHVPPKLDLVLTHRATRQWKLPQASATRQGRRARRLGSHCICGLLCICFPPPAVCVCVLFSSVYFASPLSSEYDVSVLALRLRRDRRRDLYAPRESVRRSDTMCARSVRVPDVASAQRRKARSDCEGPSLFVHRLTRASIPHRAIILRGPTIPISN